MSKTVFKVPTILWTSSEFNVGYKGRRKLLHNTFLFRRTFQVGIQSDDKEFELALDCNGLAHQHLHSLEIHICKHAFSISSYRYIKDLFIGFIWESQLFLICFEIILSHFSITSLRVKLSSLPLKSS